MVHANVNGTLTIGDTVALTSTKFLALALEDIDIYIREAQAALNDEDLHEVWGAIYDVREAAEAAERQVIGLLREQGVTWQRIGEGYGMTKQAAQQRWS
jgi:hypothetical protein